MKIEGCPFCNCSDVKLHRNIRLCHDNCSFLLPKEIDQTEFKEFHYCLCYDKILRHHGFHPHLVACKECKFLSFPKEFYYDRRNYKN